MMAATTAFSVPELWTSTSARAAALCQCVELGSWRCHRLGHKVHRLGKQLYSHPKLMGQKLNYCFIVMGPGACTCLFWHPALSRSLLFGMHRPCLTKCCWIRTRPPLKLLLKPLKLTVVLPKNLISLPSSLAALLAKSTAGNSCNESVSKHVLKQSIH